MSTDNNPLTANATQTAQGAEGSDKTDSGFRAFISKYGIFLIFLGMCLLLAIITIDNGVSIFLKYRNIVNVLRQSSVIGIIACGVTFIIITGGIDLSSGSLVALIGCVSALVARAEYGLPWILAVVVAMALGLLAGAINGSLIAKAKIPPFIATLGMMVSARGVGFLITGGRPIDNLSESYQFIGQGTILNWGENFFIPVPVLIFLSVALVSHFLLSQTRFGKYTYALGGNEQAAYICGVNVDRHKVMVYSFAGLLTSIAAVVLTSRVSAGQPSAGVMYELDAIASAVIGGTSLQGGIGVVGGTVVGTLIIGVMNNGLDLLGVSSYYQQILKGLIIIGAVVIDTMRHRRAN
ncbi:MAG: ABC transporter permease [Spirochaetaceae bacterium]|nr:ABC transporter permease [Spirochaetaceae bacterium]